LSLDFAACLSIARALAVSVIRFHPTETGPVHPPSSAEIVRRGPIWDNRVDVDIDGAMATQDPREGVFMAFAIELSPDAREHLRRLRTRDQRNIVDAIAVHLTQQPDYPTRHRKRLEDNPLAPWELRVGDFRVFHDLDYENEIAVVVAIGHKVHDQLRIGDEEVEL
jgi:mRNA-degrading endonuclease RelE of RelBE toxin-antitoxin system